MSRFDHMTLSELREYALAHKLGIPHMRDMKKHELLTVVKQLAKMRIDRQDLCPVCEESRDKCMCEESLVSYAVESKGVPTLQASQEELEECKEVMHRYDDNWFAEYVNLGGVSNRETFIVQLNYFFALTMEAFISGTKDREESWNAWVKHVGSRPEAERYFRAVDSVTPYT